jgi:hypothetical protein
MIRSRQSFRIAALATIMVLPVSTVLAADWMKTLQGTINNVTQGSGASSTSVMALSNEDIIAGLKEALRVGAETVTGQLGSADGFNSDPSVHIPLPDELKAVQSTLKRIGLSSLADDIELKLNRGAEAAMPKAKELVWKAITEMTLDDAKAIYDGPKDAATQYFRRVSTSDLEAAVAPVIDGTLRDVGAIAAYDQLLGQYKTVPFVPDLKADLTAHATGLALDGLFKYLASEEADIRSNPAKRTTEILTKVFGAK